MALDTVEGDRARVLISATSVVSNAQAAEGDTIPAAVPAAGVARRRSTLVLVTVGLLLGFAVLAGSVYWTLCRPDRPTGEAAQQKVVAAAKDGIEAAFLIRRRISTRTSPLRNPI